MLGDSVENPCFIETVPGVGYAFVGTVDKAGEPRPIEHGPIEKAHLATERTPDLGTADLKTTAAPTERSTSHIAVYAVLLATIIGVTVATSAAAYGVATLLFCLGGALATLRYVRVQETISGRVALGTFLIAGMAYIPSAATLTEVTATAVNAGTLKPAIAYPFITGLKFIPLFVFLYWALLLLGNNAGFRQRPGSGKAYMLIGALFLVMTSVSVATGSGDYRMFKTRLPGSPLLVAGYALVLSINVAVGLYAYRFFNRDSILGYRRLFFVCGILYLPLALVAVLIDHDYNYLNKYYLDKRRPEAYVASNPSAIDSFPDSFKRTLPARIGPDLAGLLNDPEFS
jgi:hypothetical protein